jgi:hypothetical protein
MVGSNRGGANSIKEWLNIHSGSLGRLMRECAVVVPRTNQLFCCVKPCIVDTCLQFFCLFYLFCLVNIFMPVEELIIFVQFGTRL